MAQSGFTPIVLYNSSVNSNVPDVADLQAGELALNIPDGLLFFNQSGTITTLANSGVNSHLSWVGGSQQTLSVLSTGAFKVPVGSVLNYPATSQLGMLRYTAGIGFEGYQTVDGAAILSMTNVGTLATVTTAQFNGFVTSTKTIVVTGATPAAYNGTFLATYVDDNTFTYTMLSDPGSSATVEGTYTYDDWARLGTGNGGGSSEAGGAILVNKKEATVSYEIDVTENGFSVGPITIADGVTITVDPDSRWVII